MSSHQWQHYLAQSYLKGFSPYFLVPDASARLKQKVWCFNKRRKTIELLNVDKVARVPRWYSTRTGKQSFDDELEEAFGNFEQHYPSLLAKVRSWIEEATFQGSILSVGRPFEGTLTDAEKAYLGSYIALHSMRVPHIFGKIRDMATDRFEEHPSLADAYEAGTGSRDPGNAAVMGFLHSAKKLAPEVITILMKKNMIIDFSPTRRLDILTGDQPVIKNEGFGAVLFPLFQRAFLRFEGSGLAVGLKRIPTEKMVQAFNQNICGIAQEQVFGANSGTLAKVAESLHLEYTIIEPEKNGSHDHDGT